MKAKDLKNIFHDQLDALYGKEEVSSFFYLSIEHHLNVDRIQLILDPEFNLTKPETKTLLEVLEALKQQRPIQYILGETEFYGLTFNVNKNVLIPRPETEELVDWIIKCHAEHSRNNKNAIKILDIGTGSGCIAISLAKHMPEAKVFAVDLSESALKIAKENAEENNVNIQFVKGDALKLADEDFFPIVKDVSQRQNGFFDIIVSNPPYVRQLEKQEIKPNVLNNEPHLALFVENENPLIFYKAISDFAVDNLKSNGSLYFEINQYLGQETKQLLVDAEFKAVELRKDLNGNDRMLKGTKK
ncbi:peptide chain release factor N(5)-glutamine methyltransferase [Winogradskyella aquimaris]|uniref:Release factor glutamine methyltransferase n=1 Tax=Winogradskyella aquimaris TaxID=864074 RepID=A0ABU5ESK8_9FLAO|nr:peptide chain release factor N(5)-glutamine methyltransferase [Winogradskyella aquimaris]MDY2587672.1 peptide chain release factor N(5)-glutamine methyltransferase [Winogradskyella aquimaris]